MVEFGLIVGCQMAQYKHDQQIIHIIEAATDRLLSEVETYFPSIQDMTQQWVKKLSASEHPAEYYKALEANPILLLPWWAGKKLNPCPDQDFHADLAYSTISIYYFVRIIDNIVDREQTVETLMLPLLGFLHTQWQYTFQRYFEYGHPFWDYFRQTWFEAWEITIRDSRLQQIERETFLQTSSQKSHAATIPIAAVLYRHQNPQAIKDWRAFFRCFQYFHQMHNDLFGWIKDLRHQAITYFLSEAARRKRPEESIPHWIVREGFEWGMGEVSLFFGQTREAAALLSNRDLELYLDAREALIEEQADRMSRNLGSAEMLLKALEEGTK